MAKRDDIPKTDPSEIEALIQRLKQSNLEPRDAQLVERLLRLVLSMAGKLRDECLNGEIFYSLKEAQIVIEKWRVNYNTKRPHSALGYRPPAPVVDGGGAGLVGDEIAR